MKRSNTFAVGRTRLFLLLVAAGIALLFVAPAAQGRCPYEQDSNWSAYEICWWNCRMEGKGPDSMRAEHGMQSCDEICDRLCPEEPVSEEVKTDCPEFICRGNVLHIKPRRDPASGRCVSNNTFNCSRGCDAKAGKCIGSQLKLTNLAFSPYERGLILNGRDAITLTGVASYRNPLNEPLKGQKIDLEARIDSPSGTHLPKALGIRVFPAYVDESTRFSGKLVSEHKMPPQVALDRVTFTVTARGLPEASIQVSLISPAPVVVRAEQTSWREPKQKGGVWQDAYGVFQVETIDPDHNIVAYTLRSRFGTFRLNKQEWGGKNEKVISTRGWSDPYAFTFAWRAPPVTEHMRLDLLRDLRSEWMKAAKEGVRTGLEHGFDSLVRLGLGEGAARLIDREKLIAIAEAARNGKTGAVGLELLKYGLSKNDATGGFYTMINDQLEAQQTAKSMYAEISEHTGGQAAKMGQAFSARHQYYKEEMTVRTLSILVDGIKVRDGSIEVLEKVSGEQEDKGLSARLKEIAYSATLNSLQKSLEYVADTYKGAGARLNRLPFFIYVGARDRDGFWGRRTLVVEVSGYESVIQ